MTCIHEASRTAYRVSLALVQVKLRQTLNRFSSLREAIPEAGAVDPWAGIGVDFSLMQVQLGTSSFKLQVWRVLQI